MYAFVVTLCTNYFSVLILRADSSLKCAHLYYKIVLLYLILIRFFSFSLLGAVVSALRALLHAPILLIVAYRKHCICTLNWWVKKVK